MGLNINIKLSIKLLIERDELLFDLSNFWWVNIHLSWNDAFLIFIFFLFLFFNILFFLVLLLLQPLLFVFSLNRFQMDVQVVLFDKLFWTVRAWQCLHTSVDHIVLVKISLLRKRRSTKYAFIWLFFCVNSHMVENVNEAI